jgi:hypothetical protein
MGLSLKEWTPKFEIVFLITYQLWISPLVKLHKKEGDSEGFLRWCITLRITEFYGFTQRLVFQKIENTTFRKLNLFPSSNEGETHVFCLSLALSKGPNRAGVPMYLRTETDPVSEKLRSLVFGIQDDGQRPNT